MWNCVPFIWERDHSEDKKTVDLVFFFPPLWCYSSWEHNPLYWQCLIIPHKKTVSPVIAFLPNDPRSNEIRAICEELKNSKNFLDQNEKNFGLSVVRKKKKITAHLLRNRIHCSHLPPRHRHSLNQDVSWLYFKGCLETEPRRISKGN